ncbi:hypothetical protein D6B99_16135 [Arachidicoccus soli]|uniref:Uncharacterized protein n=1 Tax=Arachidicoccus soli TaxID=2341117 RepID=A0A386HSU1_9BACT|nr:hypothetical protein D6B99_16135 [Arachidicoccus soli]
MNNYFKYFNNKKTMSKKPIEHSINFLPKINKIPLLLIAVLFTGSLWAQAVNRQISGVVKNTDNKSS